MTKQVDLVKYTQFVDGTTSYPSKSNEEFIARIRQLAEGDVPIAKSEEAICKFIAKAKGKLVFDGIIHADGV